MKDQPPYGGGGGFQRGPGGRNEQPSRSVWLGNIHPDTSEPEIRQEFSGFGMIESVKILPHKNCAFVNFLDLNDAINAHAHTFGKILRGNELKAGWGKVEPVQEDRNMNTRPNSDKFTPCKNLWVGNLSERISEDELRHEFEGMMTFFNISSLKTLYQIGLRNLLIIIFLYYRRV